MQALITKFLPPSNVRGARVKASCSAGSITVDYYDAVESSGGYSNGDEELHAYVADLLKKKLAKERNTAYWDRPTVCGCIFRTGEFAHVYLPSEG